MIAVAHSLHIRFARSLSRRRWSLGFPMTLLPADGKLSINYRINSISRLLALKCVNRAKSKCFVKVSD